MRNKSVLLLAVGLTCALTACGGSGANESSKTKSDVKVVTVGYQKASVFAPLFVAMARDYYGDQGLSVTLEPIKSAQDANVLLSQGKLDALVGSMSAGFFNASEQGLESKVVGSLGTVGSSADSSTTPPNGVYARPDKSGSAPAVSSLKGKPVAIVGAIGTGSSYAVGRVLETGGLTLKDVSLKNLSSPDSLAALESGAVSAAFLTAPFNGEAEKSGKGVLLVDSGKAYGDAKFSAIFYGPKLLKDDRKAGAAFLAATIRAARDLQGDYRKDAQVVDILAKALDVDKDAITATGPFAFDKDLAPGVDTAADMQRMFLQLPELLTYKEPLSATQLFDEEMNKDAVKIADAG